MTETRKLAAILAADVVGFSRMTGRDEDRTLARLRTLRSDHLDPVIAIHHGRTVKRIGDGALVEFRSVVNAVRCAMELQPGMAERNARLQTEQRIEFRMGIHVGDVVEEHDGDLMGDGVNIAARLESISEPNGVCLSSAAYEQVRDRVNLGYIDLGARELKNIVRPVRVYQICLCPGPNARWRREGSGAPRFRRSRVRGKRHCPMRRIGTSWLQRESRTGPKQTVNSVGQELLNAFSSETR